MSSEEQPREIPDWITAHVKLYRENPEQGRLWDSTPVGGPGVLPCLLLITRGRKSGKTSTLPLIYTEYGKAYVIIASKGGAPAHPAWYLNLTAEANCEIQVGKDHYRARARTAEGEERKALWRTMAGIYPPYDDYQVTAGDRLIPVVVLEPIAQGAFTQRHD